ncbi:MAG: tRNA 4-thiouridine(8) synthase ThiI [Candidatus Woesearchaeota archaeon]|jgi:thiamine biosynthesis protein ThiI|nr:tRNA 4-thiouridine(8) synthase ThiI [Candidatus Woesearchaeota archaeon]
MEKVLVKSSEIALKGRNRYVFENKLIENIKKSAKKNNVIVSKITLERFRLIIDFDSSKEKIKNTLNKVFGISNYSFIYKVEKDIDEILKKSKEMMLEIKELGHKQISFNTTRGDKNFKFKSPEINSKMGEVASKIDLKVNYKTTESTIFLDISDKSAYLSHEKYKGLEGLPVGTSGKVLVLLSGGIDSPVAAYQILKRGCEVDFLHFHTFENNDEILNTKIKKIIEKVNEYGFESKLHAMPCQFYRSLTCDKIKFDNYRLVMFKHFIFRMADELVKKEGYDAIVSGDALAQVASQTIENMRATQTGLTSLILRPLLTYQKEEIITIARKIDTFELSIEEYKDCCSLAAKNPQTKSKVEVLNELLKEMNFEEIIEKCLTQVKSYDFK